MVRKVEVDFSQVWAQFFFYQPPFHFSLLGMLSSGIMLPNSAWHSFAEYTFCSALFRSQVRDILCGNVCNSMISSSFVLLNAPSFCTCESICLSFSEREEYKGFPPEKTPQLNPPQYNNYIIKQNVT